MVGQPEVGRGYLTSASQVFYRSNFIILNGKDAGITGPQSVFQALCLQFGLECSHAEFIIRGFVSPDWDILWKIPDELLLHLLHLAAVGGGQNLHTVAQSEGRGLILLDILAAQGRYVAVFDIANLGYTQTIYDPCEQ